MLQPPPVIQSNSLEYPLPQRQYDSGTSKTRPKSRRYRDDQVKKILEADQASPPVPAMTGKHFLTWLNS